MTGNRNDLTCLGAPKSTKSTSQRQLPGLYVKVKRVYYEVKRRECLPQKVDEQEVKVIDKKRLTGANFPVRGHPRGSKVVPLNSWGRVSY